MKNIISCKIIKRKHTNNIKNKGITLIALVITIIVLLILAGISIAILTGENGILTKADTSVRQTDIVETKEQIKLEIMGNADENGNYTNADVIEAVKKITDNDIEEETNTIKTKKGNDVDISDLWQIELKFYAEEKDEKMKITYKEGDRLAWRNRAI